MPTLIDGDVKIHESNAILKYLCHKYDLSQWYPNNLAARACVEQWLDWTQCRFSPTVVDIVLNKVFLQEKGDAKAIERGLEQLTELTEILEQHLTDHDYLAGAAPTALIWRWRLTCFI